MSFLDKNFWEEYPELKYVFDAEFVKSQDSSNIMWCIRMYKDPRSELSLAEPDQRLEYVRKYYPDFNPSDYLDIIDQYMGLVPDIEIYHNMLLRDAKAVIKFVTDLPMTKKNLDDKVTYGEKANKLVANIAVTAKKVLESRSIASANGKGHYEPSRSERGVIGKA